MRKLRSTILAALATIVTSTAHAEFVDASQPIVRGAPSFPDFFSSYAQTFTVENDGTIIALELPISCGSNPSNEGGVSLRDASVTEPEGPVLTSYRGPIGRFETPDLHRVTFPTPVDVQAGDKLSIIFGVNDGCFIYQAGAGSDPYPNGTGYFQGQFGEEWQAINDLPFKVIMEKTLSLSHDDACRAADGTLLPVWRHAPACRCFEDQSLLESRCGVLHPDFFLERIAPLIVKPGTKFEVIWKFTPRKELSQPVLLTLNPDSKNAKTLKFGYKSKPGIFEQTSTKHIIPYFDQSEPELAEIDYNMKDAPSDAFTKFRFQSAPTGSAKK